MKLEAMPVSERCLDERYTGLSEGHCRDVDNENTNMFNRKC
jgi:hypothetical protein